MTVPAKAETTPAPDVMESVIVKGDLAKLTPDERVRYYNETCRSLGLNPLTKPFDFHVLNGRMVLYASRNCADQLRKINNVSLEIVSRVIANNILSVHVRARLPDGRSDEDYGSVWFPDTLAGEARANAELKAITKGKRRATLSICGLGWLDQTEVDDIPVMAHRRPPPPGPNAMLPPTEDEPTGDVIRDADGDIVPPEHDQPPPPLALEDMAREAAMRGEATFKAFYGARSKAEKDSLKSIGDELRALMAEGHKDAAT